MDIVDGSSAAAIGSRRGNNGLLANVQRVDFVGLSTLVIYSLVVQAARQNQVARHALSESEKRYRLLFDNNPLPMWVYDAETLAILEVNEAAVAQYQYPRPEFLQLNIKEIRPPEDVPCC